MDIPKIGEEFDADDMLTPEGKKKAKEDLKKGIPIILFFNDNGKKITVKITQASKKTGYKAMVIPELYEEEEGMEKIREIDLKNYRKKYE